MSTEHFFARAINANYFVAIEARAGKRCEATQINVHIVVVVMPPTYPGSMPEYGVCMSVQITVSRTPGIGFMPKLLSTPTWL